MAYLLANDVEDDSADATAFVFDSAAGSPGGPDVSLEMVENLKAGYALCGRKDGLDQSMAAGDEMVEGSASSVPVDAWKSGQSDDVLSAEDAAWVDSCLVKDPETSSVDWNSLTDALLEILCSPPKSNESSAPESGSSPRGNDVELLSFSEAEGVGLSGGTDEDPLTVKDTEMNGEVQEDTEMIDDGNLEDSTEKEVTVVSSSQLEGNLSETSMRGIFLPTYNEDNQRVSEATASKLDVGSPRSDMDPPTKDIFRVWDLGISAEEDEKVELEKQLEKALSESPVKLMPPLSKDPGALKDVEEVSVDDLVASIADLSLGKRTS